MGSEMCIRDRCIGGCGDVQQFRSDHSCCRTIWIISVHTSLAVVLVRMSVMRSIQTRPAVHLIRVRLYKYCCRLRVHHICPTLVNRAEHVVLQQQLNLNLPHCLPSTAVVLMYSVFTRIGRAAYRLPRPPSKFRKRRLRSER